MKTSEAVVEIMPALIAFQAEVRPIVKDATNPHFKSKYADLESIRSIINPILSKHNLFACHFCDYTDGRIIVQTYIFHKSGQWIATSVSMKPAQDTPQSIGSSITYGMRYGLVSLLGLVVGDDDDGEAGSRKPMSKGFDPKNPKSVQWLNALLATTTVPESSWSLFAAQIEGMNLDQINAKIKEYKKK